MALKKLTFKPGINRDITNYSDEGGWWACDKVRFRKGYPNVLRTYRSPSNTFSASEILIKGA